MDPAQAQAIRAYRLARVRKELSERDYAAAVLSDPINIRYCTGTRNMQVWTLHHPARYVVVLAEGPVVLFEFKDCEHISTGLETVDEVRRAVAWYYYAAGPEQETRAKRWAAEIADLIQSHGGGNRRVAFDRLDPPGMLAIQAQGLRVENGGELMAYARAIKSSEEIDAMRDAIDACEEGIRRMKAALRPGITENQLWSVLHQANIELGGEWLETRLLCSGPRTNPWYQECGDRIIEDGDLVAFDTDLVGRHGIAVDISETWLAGDRSANDEQRRLYDIAYEQIQRNIEVLKPGRTFQEIADLAWMPPEPFQHYMYPGIAHGVGLCNEFPAIRNRKSLTRYPGILQENMTFCVESYIGEVHGEYGIKLEKQVLVTSAGAVPLSSWDFDTAFQRPML